MQHTSVLLVFGGESAEHEVSVSSARNVFAALDDTKYNIKLCYMDRSGKWWLMESISDQISTSGESNLVPVLGTSSFMTVPGNAVIPIDVILPILHGENGEDGTVQGLAKLMHIPIVGSGVLGSAAGMDKVIAKQLFEASGINVVPYIVHTDGEPVPDFSQLVMKLGSPMFIKPANGGSSVGVTKAYDEASFLTGLDSAHEFDTKVLIEQGISARELEVGVLGHHKTAVSSGVGEITPEGDFYSYDSKYSASSQTRVSIPAAISEELSGRIKTDALKAFAAIDADGLSRVDFFLGDDEQLYLNEINTLPGFTNISMYPKLFKQEGMSYMQLIDTLISIALDPEYVVKLDN